MAASGQVVRYKVFRGIIATWDTLFAQAADFATSVGPDRLITIAHSEDKDDGVIAVWYWGSPAGRND